MTPSQAAKAAGLNSLDEAAKISNRSTRTLSNWFKSNRQFFDIIIAGCAAQTQTIICIDDIPIMLRRQAGYEDNN